MTDNMKMNDEKVSEAMKEVSFFKKVNFFQILILLVVVLVGYFAYMYKGEFVVATVNGKPVTRYELMTELEKQGAKQSLDSIIIQKLIAEKSAKENIKVSKEDIAGEIKKIQETLKGQGMELDQALEARGLTMESLIKQIKLQKELEKLVGSNVKVTDEQVKEYLTANADSFSPDLSDDDKTKQAKEVLTQQQVSSSIYTYIETLKTEAKINYLKKY